MRGTSRFVILALTFSLLLPGGVLSQDITATPSATASPAITDTVTPTPSSTPAPAVKPSATPTASPEWTPSPQQTVRPSLPPAPDKSRRPYSRNLPIEDKIDIVSGRFEDLGIGTFYGKQSTQMQRKAQSTSEDSEVIITVNLKAVSEEDVDSLFEVVQDRVREGDTIRYVPVETLNGLVVSLIGNLPVSQLRKQLPDSGIAVTEARVYKPSYSPNDPQYSSQWGLSSMNYSQAIDLGLGPSTPVLGIMDNGMDVSATELNANMWINTDETYGDGDDDDGNGYIDDRYGCNFDEYWVKGNTTTACLIANMDDGDTQEYHGSNVAAIAGAVTNNSTKIAGVCPSCDLMNLDVADNTNSGATILAIIKALEYAADNGADVVNFSYASTCPFDSSTDVLESYINTLINTEGISYVQSSGNNGALTQTQCTDPSSGSNPGGLNCGASNTYCNSEARNQAYYYVDGKEVQNAIFVASITQSSLRSSFSTYDPDSGATAILSIAAPGSNVHALYNDPVSGTSFAAPYVTGALGVILTKYNRTPGELKTSIELWGTDISTDNNISGKRLNLYQSYLNALATYSDVPTTYTFFSNITNLSVAGVVNGFSDSTFRPSDNVTRAHMAKFIRLAYGFPVDTSCGDFSDVSASYTFYNDITTLKCRGIIGGYSDGTFRPNNTITRAEAMKFVMLGLRNREADPDFLRYSGSAQRFSDVPTSYPFYEFIMAASNTGVGIAGGYSDGTFKPGNSITRGEMSKMIDVARNK